MKSLDAAALLIHGFHERQRGDLTMRQIAAKQKAKRAIRWGVKLLLEQGKAKEFSEWTGKSRGYYETLLKSPDPPLSAAWLLAEFLKMPLQEFLEQGEAEDDPEEDSLGDPRTVPEICSLTAVRFPQMKPLTGNEPICDRLDYLDHVRECDPMNALLGLKRLLPDLPSEQMPYLLQVAASSHRTLCEFKEASYCLNMASSIARNITENILALGDNAQRWVYLYGSVGYRRSALQRSQAAHDLFSEAGNKRKIGEAVIDRAYCYYFLNEKERSLRWYDSAIGVYFECLNFRSRIAALQGKSITLSELGSPCGALELSLEALRIARSSGSVTAQANALWAVARAYKSLGKLEESERNYIECANLLVKANPIDAILATLELAALNGGRNSDFDQLSNEIASQIKRLPALAATLEDLLAAVRMKRLSPEFLKETRAKVRGLRPAYLKSAVRFVNRTKLVR